jgi:hypothetical protein
MRICMFLAFNYNFIFVTIPTTTWILTKDWPIWATSHHQAGVIVAVQFAATRLATTSWGIVKCQRYYSKGLLG